MNDTDEDGEAEKRLQHRMEGMGSATPPSAALLAPAALYLTAILEYVSHLFLRVLPLLTFSAVLQGHLRVRLSSLSPHVATCPVLTETPPAPAPRPCACACKPRHVLSNVSRVASRDSSRTLATVQDLFIALGEDDTIYSMFKSLKGAHPRQPAALCPIGRRPR